MTVIENVEDAGPEMVDPESIPPAYAEHVGRAIKAMLP